MMRRTRTKDEKDEKDQKDEKKHDKDEKIVLEAQKQKTKKH